MTYPSHILSEIEAAISALEYELGLSITIIDNSGVFRNREGEQLLGRRRQSHRKNPVCELGFCDACIQHCRHEMNARGEEVRKPFVHSCWKGVIELAVPLIWNNSHFGTLFAGLWRRSEVWEDELPPGLPEDWYGQYMLLPEYDPARLERIGHFLQSFAMGILQQLEDLLMVGQAPTGRQAEVQRYLRYNYAKNIRLTDLADALYLSPSRTSHLVKELFGKTFQALLREERMTAAKALLLTTDLSASEVAERVGMSDEYHFNRTFREVIGTPPGRFRREAREGRLPPP